MRQSRTPKESGGNGSDATSTQEAEIVDRLIASAAGLPRICALKRCRRRKRCFGAFGSGEVPCLSQHKGLVRARYASALKRLGWDRPRAHASPSVVAS